MATPISCGKKRNRNEVSPTVNECIKLMKISTMESETTSNMLYKDTNLGDNAPEWAKAMFASISNQMSGNQQELNDLLVKQQQQLDTVLKKNELLEAKVQNLEKSNKFLKDKILYQEMAARKTNLIFHGIVEPVWEHREQCEKSVKDFLITLSIDTTNLTFSRIHRLGPKTITRPHRPILVSFNTMDDRDTVWKARPKNIKDPNTPRISQDFPKEIQSRRRRLLPVLVKAKQIEEYQDTYLFDDKLVIKGLTYTVDNLHLIPNILDPRYIATQTQDNMTVFWGQNSPLSNHHPASFLQNGTLFNCVEQFYMYSMAEHAGDKYKAQAIMDTENPITQKQIAKGITLSKEWKNMSVNIMKTGLIAKFSQNEILKDFLLDTKETELIEASPYDKFWGIGLSMDTPEVFDKTKWKGKNMLGQLLQTVRNTLK